MSTLKTNTLSNVAGTASTAIENAINGSAKAWVNFNGQNTVAIRASFNVTSITDNGLGNYTVNMTNALADTSYAIIGTANNDITSTGGTNSTVVALPVSTTQATVVNVVASAGTQLFDPPIFMVSIFR
jgi:hypothetical protein